MNNKLKLIHLTAFGLLTTSTAWSQPLEQLNTDIHSESLSSYLQNKQQGWFAYRIEAAPNTANMCCYNYGQSTACDLSEKRSGYGSSSDSPDTDHINILVHLDDGEVNTIMPVGDHCTVKAEGITVDWLTQVDEEASIDWLQQTVVKQHAGDDQGALYTLGLHPSGEAAEALLELAQQQVSDYSEQAVFWLGQRHRDGYQYLKKLYETLPVGEVRRKLNFALSQNQTTQAVELLKSIAQEDIDSEQQADAIFWLSQTDEVEDLPEFLIDLMSTTESDEVQEKAIFSLSQIQSSEANQELAKLIKDHKDAEVREQSLFWLAQNSPERARVAAMDLLKTAQHESEQENAVFVLSQLPSKQSSAALFSVIKGDYSRHIKKKALFWLSQSDDEDTISQLEKLL